MAFGNGPKIVTDGLVLSLDAADRNSYVSGSTTWFDVSGNTNNGTLTNGPTFSSADGGSIVFDGVDDYVDCPRITTFTNASQFSLCAWMKRSLSNSIVIIGQIVSLTDDVSFELWSDGNAYFEVGNGTNSYGFVSNTGTSWQFLSMVFDGTQTGNSNRLKGYINNIQQSLTFNNTIPSSTGTVNATLSIGRYLTNYSTGNIATTQIYNRALSTQEVLQNYNAQKSRFGL